jgi:SAM-dependent methyltransferase
MDEAALALLTDLHLHNDRQGPGSEASFLKALALSGINTKAPLAIADIGCGTGSATLPLLHHTKANVTAVDFLPAFLDKLQANAEAAGVADRVSTVEADMHDLPFADEQFDAIWAEGAIYNVGFATGVQDWRRFLKPGGVLAVSEITWLQPDVPTTLQTHWANEYSEVATAASKIAILEAAGYSLLGYFPLPSTDWREHYYHPLQAGFSSFLETHNNSEAAHAIVAAEEAEIALYEQYHQYYSYGFYIAKKV